MPRRPVEPGQVWFVDFDPTLGREQGKGRPALVVSSRSHLSITRGELVGVLPLRSVERVGCSRRIQASAAGGSVVTEQICTVSISRPAGMPPRSALSAQELREVRRVLDLMLTA